MARRLDIKNLVPRKNGPYRQGYYQAINPEKYVGDFGKIIFRSAWERRFCIFCDTNPAVIAWSSETIQIQYIDPIDQRMKPYNVDFYMKIKRDGAEVNYIIEVKPAKKLLKPEIKEKRISEKRMNAHIVQTKEYIVNMHKFEAAKKWAKDRGWEFLVVTENFLYGNG